MSTPIVKAVARAMYESHGFKKPWDHPDTVKKWHAWQEAEAKAAIAAYRKYIRSVGRETK